MKHSSYERCSCGAELVCPIELKVRLDQTSLGVHPPGQRHDYQLTCVTCGERGVIRLTIDPERTSEAVQAGAE